MSFHLSFTSLGNSWQRTISLHVRCEWGVAKQHSSVVARSESASGSRTRQRGQVKSGQKILTHRFLVVRKDRAAAILHQPRQQAYVAPRRGTVDRQLSDKRGGEGRGGEYSDWNSEPSVPLLSLQEHATSSLSFLRPGGRSSDVAVL